MCQPGSAGTAAQQRGFAYSLKHDLKINAHRNNKTKQISGSTDRGTGEKLNFKPLRFGQKL